VHPALRRRRALFLPRLIAQEVGRLPEGDAAEQRAHQIVLRWAELDTRSALRAKETSLDANFLNEVFGDALGYRTRTQSANAYHLERNFTVEGVGTADGAIGLFSAEGVPRPLAVIELKDATTDLDRDRFNGRTAIQQCWDYLNALPNCPWGIVSNFATLRLYHRDRTPLAFEVFTLQDLRRWERFREFYCLLRREALLPSKASPTSTVLRLLSQTQQRQREVGDRLYDAYSRQRLALVDHLCKKQGKTLEPAIAIAQRLLDRIIFIAFCEDRGLVQAHALRDAYDNVFTFAKARNPKWRNYLDLFHAMNEGHPRLNLPRGYNGGLFRHDPEVDELQLDDEWASFFKEVGGYDFSDEVNVDVLGHLFEKSVTELERIRHGGLFGEVWESPSKMPKSAQRKRFGIFYTPQEFTRFIVDQAVGAVVDERWADLARRHGLDPEAITRNGAKDLPAAFWRDAIEVLRSLKVCDPACGSGAFLIQAYDCLEEKYAVVVDGLGAHDERAAAELAENVPDLILADNLFGGDLSPEAAEITQLALWIRSARRGKTLADLSRNILCGNSLVADSKVDPRALAWRDAFPDVFDRDSPGFDCIIGNPPWERLKLQEREFFSFSAPKIAEAVSAAKRRELIRKLEKENPELYARYVEAKAQADKTLAYARGSDGGPLPHGRGSAGGTLPVAEGPLPHGRGSERYPLTGRGDVNTYMLFAELARTLVAPTGRVGLLVPSGIATDDTTKEFFQELMSSRGLISLHDFENKRGLFPDVHRAFKFCTLILGGSRVKRAQADFVFFAHSMEDVADPKRHIPLTEKDLALLNPNTRTCPIFRTRRDAELTRAIYRRVPILVDESRKEGGNPWGIRFLRMFDQTNDAELFHTGEQLKKGGVRLAGNRWVKRKETYLPLYEAKMIQAYDHRAAGVVVDTENWMRQGRTERTSLVSHQNPEFVVQPRWWVSECEVRRVLDLEDAWGFVGFKDITSPTNQRTMIAAAVPWSAVTNHFPLLLSPMRPRLTACLLGNLNTLALDYAARQKIGGITLNFFITRQLPILPPEAYAERCPWRERTTLEKWVSDRVLKLTCTSDDMRPFAESAGLDPPVHRWNPAERARLLAELDAAYFLLYGIERDDVKYILSTFAGAQGPYEDAPMVPPIARSVLEAYDELAAAGTDP
jgi:hypothetical protein